MHSNGHADVLDMDGRLLTFGTGDDARNHLLEDEYVSMDRLTEEDYAELQLHPEQLIPPVAPSDAELVPKMFIRRGCQNK